MLCDILMPRLTRNKILQSLVLPRTPLIFLQEMIVDSGIRSFEEILRSSTSVYVRRRIMAPKLHPCNMNKEDVEDILLQTIKLTLCNSSILQHQNALPLFEERRLYLMDSALSQNILYIFWLISKHLICHISNQASSNFNTFPLGCYQNQKHPFLFFLG